MNLKILNYQTINYHFRDEQVGRAGQIKENNCIFFLFVYSFS